MHFRIATAQGSFLTPAYEHAVVGDAMHPGLFACDPDDLLTDVARLMAVHHVHYVPVMTLDDRRLHGVVSDVGLLRAAGEAVEQTAGQAADTDFVSAAPDEALPAAVERMAAAGASHAVVLRDGEPVGVLSTADVAGVIAWGRA